MSVGTLARDCLTLKRNVVVYTLLKDNVCQFYSDVFCDAFIIKVVY